MVGWLVGCCGFNRQYLFQSISGCLTERGRKRTEKTEESKNVQPPPPPPPSSAPTIIQTVGCPGTGSVPRTIAPPDTPEGNGVNRDLFIFQFCLIFFVVFLFFFCLFVCLFSVCVFYMFY